MDTIRKLPASDGAEWLLGGFALLRRAPLALGALGALWGLLASLVMTVGLAVPALATILQLLVALAGQLLAAPVGELIALYGGNFVLRPLSPENIAALCGIGAGLGWLGAQLSVAIHLRRL